MRIIRDTYGDIDVELCKQVGILALFAVFAMYFGTTWWERAGLFFGPIGALALLVWFIAFLEG